MADGQEMATIVGDASPDFRHVLACVFGVQKHESRTYLALLDAPGSTVAELADRLDRDRSNVNRSLTTLLEKGLVARERRLLDPGGYVYQYTATPLPEAKRMLHDALDEWVASVRRAIDEFEAGGRGGDEGSHANDRSAT